MLLAVRESVLLVPQGIVPQPRLDRACSPSAPRSKLTPTGYNAVVLHTERLGACILLGLFALLASLFGRETGYYTVLNDFWGNAFAATHWKWSARQQWNGFFPPGYPTILHVLPGRRLVESAYLFNVVSGVVLLWAVWEAMRRWAGLAAAVAALLAVSMHPMIVTQVLTTGPDASFVTLAVAGALLAFSAAGGRPASLAVAVGAGACLGLACWIRFHGLTWGAAVLIAALLTGGRQAVAPVLKAGAIFTIVVGLLAWVGLAAGDLGALTRDQAFNVYSRLIHPVNWFHLDREPIPQSLVAAVARNPEAFWRNYLAFSAPHLWLGLGCIIAALIARGRSRRFALFALMTGVLFVPIVNLGASPRGIASYVPLVLMAVVWAASDVLTRISQRAARWTAISIVVAASAMYGWLAWTPEISRYLDEARFRSVRASQIEQMLLADRVKIGTQVFAVADFYFVHAPGWHVGNYFPRIKGGWPVIDLPEYLTTYPPPSTENLDAFLDDCLRFGVSHLVLGDGAGAMFRELGQLFDGRIDSERTTLMGEVSGIRVYRIVR
jgi:Dolichyl-phosphate-mannose-protein mannosyltransferase